MDGAGLVGWVVGTEAGLGFDGILLGC